MNCLKNFEWILSKCQPVAPKHKFRFKNPLSSLDTTVIDLCLSLYDWAKFRTTKEASENRSPFPHRHGPADHNLEHAQDHFGQHEWLL